MMGDGYHDVPPGKLAMVVTHLEMTAKPPVRPCSAPEGIRLCEVKPTLAWYRDIFTRVGALEWLWFSRLKMSDDALTAILNDPNVIFHTLSKDGKDEALLELDFRESDQCELAYFGLTPKLIGTGAGRYLMNAAIDYAWARDISRLHVHTCTADSQQALAFYIRSGFTPYKRQIEIDDDPRALGLLPKDAGPHMPII